MSKKISFKGKLDDGEIETITLHTINGKTGYRITKFQIFPETPNVNQESLVCIFKKPQTAAASTVDFSDSTLLASGLYVARESNLTQDLEVVFDNEVVNQDIYITHTEGESTRAINYYMELEVMAISDIQSTQLTLKSLRSVASR
jgi:hypothetical protein